MTWNLSEDGLLVFSGLLPRLRSSLAKQLLEGKQASLIFCMETMVLLRRTTRCEVDIAEKSGVVLRLGRKRPRRVLIAGSRSGVVDVVGSTEGVDTRKTSTDWRKR